MAVRNLPEQSVLLKLFRYDPETGKLFWRFRSDGFGGRAHLLKSWNDRYSGTEAGTVTCWRYRQVVIDGTVYKSHRVIYKIVHSTDPFIVDHINGDTLDNRAVNLRSVDDHGNNLNQKRSADNKSGVTGVFVLKDGRYLVSIGHKRKQYRIGVFDDFVRAVSARKDAEWLLGFHPNHGRD